MDSWCDVENRKSVVSLHNRTADPRVDLTPNIELSTAPTEAQQSNNFVVFLHERPLK